VRFQRRFELRPGGTDGVLDFVYFVFGTRSTPLEELTPRTALQRAGLAHLRAGGRWHNRTGRIALDRLQ